MLYDGETWPANSGNKVRLERNDVRGVTWMCIVTPKDRISAVKLRNRL